MFLKWFLLGTLLTCSFISFSESNPTPSQTTESRIEGGIFNRIWTTLTEMGKKFIEKLKSLAYVLPFFQTSTVTTMKLSKDISKAATNFMKEDPIMVQRPNMINTVNAIIEKSEKDKFHNDRFKREAARGRWKRRRSGEEYGEEYGGADRNDEYGGEEEEGEEDEEMKRRRRRRKSRRRGRY